ncbi:hypothetical protein [Clostridium baratii]|uniref:hypothetical protein n=1 Tax=Clostridium baratii TaxID=1561 RepID=UPI003A5FDD31
MAKLTIRIEENEFALYDVSTYVNGELVHRDGNCTTEENAIFFGREAAINYLDFLKR